jgi:hypothetical protein
MQGLIAPTGTLVTEPRVSEFRIEAPFKQGILPEVAVDSDLSTYARMAIVALTFYGESSWPAHRTIAQLMACSLTRARKALKELQAKGWLTIEPFLTAHGSQTTNTYVLHEPGRVAVPRYRHTISPYRHAIPIKNQNLSVERKEEKTGAPRTEAPISYPQPTSESETGTARGRLIKLFGDLAEAAIGHRPSIVLGRDQKIMGILLGRYGEEVTGEIIRNFVTYRSPKRMVLTIPALMGAAEAIYQKSRSGQARRPVREHHIVRQEREWREYKARQPDCRNKTVGAPAPVTLTAAVPEAR